MRKVIAAVVQPSGTWLIATSKRCANVIAHLEVECRVRTTKCGRQRKFLSADRKANRQAHLPRVLLLAPRPPPWRTRLPATWRYQRQHIRQQHTPRKGRVNSQGGGAASGMQDSASRSGAVLALAVQLDATQAEPPHNIFTAGRQTHPPYNVNTSTVPYRILPLQPSSCTPQSVET